LDARFDEFVVDRSPAMLRTAVLLCAGDRYAAEDLLQSALLRLARHWWRVLPRTAGTQPVGPGRPLRVH
jgi:DNA-directed RNA polymerase specialized sigma24 family protein